MDEPIQPMDEPMDVDVAGQEGEEGEEGNGGEQMEEEQMHYAQSDKINDRLDDDYFDADPNKNEKKNHKNLFTDYYKIVQNTLFVLIGICAFMVICAGFIGYRWYKSYAHKSRIQQPQMIFTETEI